MRAAIITLLTMAILASQPAHCQTGLPLYFGFFPNSSGLETQLKQLAFSTLNNTLGIEEVRLQYCNYTNQSIDTPISDLVKFAYTNPTLELHVTSYYCNYGNVADCARWASQPAVRSAIGRGFALNVTAFLLTPRTIGYRVELGTDALTVWGNTEGEQFPGQRAHFTVATSPGVGAVQTGIDLLAVAKKVGRPIASNSKVLDFKEAQYLVLLNQPVPAIFRPSDAASALGPISWMLLLVSGALSIIGMMG